MLSLKLRLSYLLILTLAVLVYTIVSFMLIGKVNAQLQTDAFSGNDPNSYQCFGADGKPSGTIPTLVDGVYVCSDTGNPAYLKPPKLQQLEIWFIRVVYVIWAVVAMLSFLYLILLGYRYMISRGDVTKITEIRQKIVYYVIGFALVFLAVPIIATIFRLMGIGDHECYTYNFDSRGNFVPGFQFFYENICYKGEG